MQVRGCPSPQGEWGGGGSCTDLLGGIFSFFFLVFGTHCTTSLCTNRCMLVGMHCLMHKGQGWEPEAQNDITSFDLKNYTQVRAIYCETLEI